MKTMLASAPRPPVIGRLVDSYRIVAPLGEGGCGAVWLAEHDVIGTKVAIKILRPEICALPGIHDRFITEARATAQIASPYVARYLDLGRLPSGESYAIMEYLDGETVRERLVRAGAFSISDALTIARQSASALAGAHAANIVHRDIKPDNIFLAATVKLLDFGIAKLVGDAGNSAYRTETGLFMGTLAYCAPEQMFGANVGVQADIYALGATLFEMLTGAPPFDGEAQALAVAKLSQSPRRVRDVRPEAPLALDELVDQMLATDAAARPATMVDVLARLEAIEDAQLEGTQGSQPRPALAPRLAFGSTPPPSTTRIGSAPPAIAIARPASAPPAPSILTPIASESELALEPQPKARLAVIVGVSIAFFAAFLAVMLATGTRESPPESPPPTRPAATEPPVRAPAPPTVTPIVEATVETAPPPSRVTKPRAKPRTTKPARPAPTSDGVILADPFE